MLFLIPGIKHLIKGTSKTSLHGLSITSLAGNDIPLSRFKGKKILIVNTASYCGFTPQYHALQELQQKFSQQLVILAFPCNDFGAQEPGKEEVIAQFCKFNYALTFELMEKLHVKGPQQHPLYTWLCNKEKNGVMNSFVLWNFQKYLVDEEGHLVDVMGPWTNPLSKKITNWLRN